MNKEELLQELSNKINTGEISREEMISKFGPAQKVLEGVEVKSKDSASFSITKMLYILGAAIVAIGIIIFFYQIWDDIGSLARITVILGLGLLFAIIGSFLLKQKPGDNIGSVFHAIGGLLIPGGSMVTLSEMNPDTISDWTVAITFCAIFIFYLVLNFIHRNAVLTFFAIANGTISIYLCLNAILGAPFEGSFDMRDIYQYVTMAIGASYILLAHAFRNSWNEKLVGVLCFFGSAGFLGAAFSQVFDSVPWQMFYFLFVLSGLFLSAYLKSRAILVVSTIFLLSHVSYITGEYFADSIGWPITLVILGFVFIGLGYVSININKKYIKN